VAFVGVDSYYIDHHMMIVVAFYEVQQYHEQNDTIKIILLYLKYIYYINIYNIYLMNMYNSFKLFKNR